MGRVKGRELEGDGGGKDRMENMYPISIKHKIITLINTRYFIK